MSAMPQFIAKRSVRNICCEVFGRALLAWAACVPVAIWLGLAAAAAAGVAIGAAAVERRFE